MKTILLVDDEQIVRDLGEEIFQTLGYDVVTAINGEDAIMKYNPQEIDAVILDVMMPVMDGIQCYRHLRKINATAPIIICSGYGPDRLDDDLFNDPNFRFAHKPFRHVELSNLIIGMICAAKADCEKDSSEL